MEKFGRFLIVILLIAVLIMGGFVSWKLIESQKETKERIEKIENKLDITDDDSDNSKKEEDKSDNKTTTEVKAFSKDDLVVNNQFKLGESAKAIEHYYDNQITSTTTTTEDATGRNLVVITCDSIGLKVDNEVSDNNPDGGMIRIKLYNDSKLTTARGIKIGDSKEKVLESYKAESILKKEDKMITVGFPGEDPIYETSNGKIYFSIENGKVSEILFAYGIAE